MAARAFRRLAQDLFTRTSGSRCCSSSAEPSPKIPHSSKKGRLLTEANIGLIISGGAHIISNTTVSRPEPVSRNPVGAEAGGLSGKPLFNLSTNVLKEMYILTRGRIPLIGCGGISRVPRKWWMPDEYSRLHDAPRKRVRSSILNMQLGLSSDSLPI